MTQLWLPIAQVEYRSFSDFPAGTIVQFRQEYRKTTPALGLRVDSPNAGGGAVPCVYALSDWFGGNAPAGDVFEAPQGRSGFGFMATPEQPLWLEADLHDSLEWNDRFGGVVGWGPRGLHLIGFWGRHGQGLHAHSMPISPHTWLTDYPEPGKIGESTAHSASWRLQLRLSEHQVVTVAEGSEG